MEYKILWHSDSDKLSDGVNEHITEGWRPLGGVSITIHFDPTAEYPMPDFYFAQAMVREEDEEYGYDESDEEEEGSEPRW
jgi:hypothetical protein